MPAPRHVGDADVVVICGTYVFPEVFPSLTSPFKPDAKLIHIDLDAFEIAKNHPVTIGFVSDPKLTLKSLADTVTDLVLAGRNGRRPPAAARAIGEANRKAMAEARARDETVRGTPCRCTCRPLPRSWPGSCRRDAIVFDEVLTHSPELTPLADARCARPVFPDPRRFAGGRASRGHRYQTGAPRSHRHRLDRRRRLDVHHPGAVDGGPSPHRRQVRHLQQSQLSLTQVQPAGLLAGAGAQTPASFPASFPALFRLASPDLDFVGLAEAMGVPAGGSRNRPKSPRRSRRCWTMTGRS